MATFIDDSFPHSHVSIGDISCVGGTIVGKIPTTFLWLRPEQMYTKDGRTWPWTVFRDPRSSDIEQGCLGDCWLLSAMALIAERPDILEHILLTKEYSHFGAYQVSYVVLRVCVDGRWKIVIVDDFFPCRIETRSIAFADGRKNQLWVPLIEKALAKQLGSYSRLLAGRTIEGLAMLTDLYGLFPPDFINIKCCGCKPNVVFTSREAGFIMGCSCGAGKREVNLKVFEKKGLLARHAYSILEVKQEGEHRYLLYLFPVVLFSKRRFLELKLKLLTGEPSTGTFWISYEDFLSHFDSVDIAKIRWFQGWAELRIPMLMGGEFSNTDKAVRILIEEPTEVCFTLFQSGARTARDQVSLIVAYICSKPIFADMIPCAASVYTDSLVQLVLKEGTVHSSLLGVCPRYVTNDFAGLLFMVDNALDDMWVHVKYVDNWFCNSTLNWLMNNNELEVRVSARPALGNFAIIGNGRRSDSDTHSPSFESPSMEQLHFHKALFSP
uniref:Calpain catalytic domain-containing protein n=1 Tax=Angiostrongylus cantonensis TaxID=6313 RepID=A0A0K0DGR5_ANGCA